MPTLTFEPENRKVDVSEGENLLQLIQGLSDYQLEALCGGQGTCGRCRVKILEGAPAPGRLDEMSLSQAELKDGYRLACQLEVEDDLTLQLEAGGGEEILTSGVQRDRISPGLNRLEVEIDRKEPGYLSLREQFSILLKEEGIEDEEFNLTALKGLASSLEDKEVLPLLVDEQRVLAIGPEAKEGAYGIAFDIGTTTVVGYLLNLLDGGQLAVTSELNPQSKFGGDVVSRINYAQQGDEELDQMQDLIRKRIKEMVKELLSEADLRADQLYYIFLVGNTSMHHLFWGLDPYSLGHAPYLPVVRDALSSSVIDLGLQLKGESYQVNFLPNIAGYLGSDTVGAMLATDIMNREEISLLIDIGTNGEVVLGSKERLLACSAAAGPAFEGAKISQGMMAREGAISRVRIEKDLDLVTIGDSKPRGICGSGLIELAGEMLRRGLVDKTGRLLKGDQLPSDISTKLRERILERDGELCFTLDEEEGVYLTQGDLRELQLAKGAIQTGVQVLLLEMEMEVEEIDNLYLAGAFGNFINKEHALRMGRLPHLPLDRLLSVGNAAGEGAKLALLNGKYRQEAEEIIDQVKYIELARHSEFHRLFTDAMYFGS